MDEVDFQICQLFMLNPRIQYREISSKLNLSNQAVHRRVQNLIQEGIINKTIADISLEYLHAIRVCIWGRSRSQNIETTIHPLMENDSTLEIFYGSGNFIYVVGLLKGLSQLETFADHVKKVAQIQDVRVGIEGYGIVSGIKFIRGHGTDGNLSPLDLRIIQIMHSDARKTIADIAEESGITIKTASKRLSQMIEKGLVEFSLDWRTGDGGSIISIMMIELVDEASKESWIETMIRRSELRCIMIGTFSNIPNQIVYMAWADSIKDLGRTVDRLAGEKGVASIVPFVLTNKYRSSTTWRDRILAESAQPPPRLAESE